MCSIYHLIAFFIYLNKILLLKNQNIKLPGNPLNFEQKETQLCPFTLKVKVNFRGTEEAVSFFQNKRELENPQIKMLILCWCQHITHDSLVDECLPVERITSLFSFMCCADLL